MFGCYRKDEVADAEFYLTAAVGVLTRYARQTILRVTDPLVGLPASSKFLPSIAEIKEACDREQAASDRETSRIVRRAEQLRARDEDNELQADRAKRPTYDELKAKYGPNWGLSIEGSKEAEKKRQEEMRASFERANRAFFERECRAEGIDPARGVSPSLLKILKSQTGQENGRQGG